MANEPADFFCSDTVTVMATNKPYVDMTISPSLNDYAWADEAILTIYDPRNKIVLQTDMCRAVGKTGWYYYRYKTACQCGIGIYRVEVRMLTTVPTCATVPTTGADTTGSSGTSGSPVGSEVCDDVQISYFRLLSTERF